MGSLPSKQTQVLHRVQGRILFGMRGTIHARTVHGTWRLGEATQPKRSSSRKDRHAGLATRADHFGDSMLTRDEWRRVGRTDSSEALLRSTVLFFVFLCVSRHKRECFNLNKNGASPREGGGSIRVGRQCGLAAFGTLHPVTKRGGGLCTPRGGSVWPGSFWDPPPRYQRSEPRVAAVSVQPTM